MNRLYRLGLTGIMVSLLAVTGHAQATQSKPISSVDRAIEMNMAAMDLAKIAESKAESSRVKSFAAMMLKDHSDTLNKLRVMPGAAADMKVNAQYQATAERLSALSGKDFDRQYMDVMVEYHLDTLKFYQDQSNQSGAAPEFAKMAKESIPTVQKHLQEAQQIQKELGAVASSRLLRIS